MSNNFILGRYYPTKSFIHSMNSTAKIICVFCFSFITLLTSSFILGMVLIGFNICLIKMSNIPLNLYLKSLGKMRFFILFLFIINSIFRVNFILNILMIIKVVLLINYSTILTLTTSPSELTYGLEIFLSPLNNLKIPANKLSLSITLALRFVPTIFDEATKIMKSQAARGVDYYHSNLKGKIEVLKTIIIPMFNLSLKKADLLGDAMEVRLFSFDRRRSNYRMNRWKYTDSMIVSGHLMLMVLVILKEVFL